MTTFSELTSRVQYMMRSFTGQHEASTYLGGQLNVGATVFSVHDGEVITSGIVEIEDELIWVESESAGVCTVPPYGRGYLGSEDTTHAINCQVLVDPTFPRVEIKRAIVDTQRALYPTLFQPKATEITFAAGQSTYELPEDCDRVLSVSWELPGSSGFWYPGKRWRMDGYANTTDYPNGSSLSVFDAVSPGQTMRVIYAAPFTELATNTTSLTDVGHQASHEDVLAYGACWRLAQFMEAGRLNLNTVENPERGKLTPPGAASALARQILALYEKRRDEERDRLLQLYPVQIRYTR